MVKGCVFNIFPGGGAPLQTPPGGCRPLDPQFCTLSHCARFACLRSWVRSWTNFEFFFQRFPPWDFLRAAPDLFCSGATRHWGIWSISPFPHGVLPEEILPRCFEKWINQNGNPFFHWKMHQKRPNFHKIAHFACIFFELFQSWSEGEWGESHPLQTRVPGKGNLPTTRRGPFRTEVPSRQHEKFGGPPTTWKKFQKFFPKSNFLAVFGLKSLKNC